MNWDAIRLSWISLEDTLSLSTSSLACEIVELDVVHFDYRVKNSIRLDLKDGQRGFLKWMERLATLICSKHHETHF
jgi:hypothetical protein